MARKHTRSLKKSVKQLDTMLQLLEVLLQDEQDRLARNRIYQLGFKIDQVRDTFDNWVLDGFIDY